MSVGGAEIQTSLLEKGRVTAFFQYERNYHSFYMLCYYKHKKGCKDKKGRPIDNTDAEVCHEIFTPTVKTQPQ